MVKSHCTSAQESLQIEPPPPHTHTARHAQGFLEFQNENFPEALEALDKDLPPQLPRCQLVPCTNLKSCSDYRLCWVKSNVAPRREVAKS